MQYAAISFFLHLFALLLISKMKLTLCASQYSFIGLTGNISESAFRSVNTSCQNNTGKTYYSTVTMDSYGFW